MDDDLGVLVGDAVLDLALEVAAGDEDRPGNGALLELVGLSHVEHDRAVGTQLLGLGRGDLGDLGLGGGEQLTE